MSSEMALLGLMTSNNVLFIGAPGSHRKARELPGAAPKQALRRHRGVLPKYGLKKVFWLKSNRQEGNFVPGRAATQRN